MQSEWKIQKCGACQRDWEGQNGQRENGATVQLFSAPFSNLMGHNIILEGPFFSNNPNFVMINVH